MHMHIRPPFIAVIVASITYVVQVLNNGKVICNIPTRSLLIAVDVLQTYSGVKSFTPNSKANTFIYMDICKDLQFCTKGG